MQKVTPEMVKLSIGLRTPELYEYTADRIISLNVRWLDYVKVGCFDHQTFKTLKFKDYEKVISFPRRYIRHFFSGFADTSTAQAYSELSGISGMTEKKVSNVQVDGKASISNIKTSKASVSGENAENYRAKFIYTMESLPVRKMVMKSTTSVNWQPSMPSLSAEVNTMSLS